MAFNNIIDLRRLGIFLNRLAEVFAPISHTHGAGEITSGTLASDRLPTVPVSKGGTGSTTAAAARTALGIGGSQVNGAQIGGINSNRQAVEVTNSGQNMCGVILKRGTMTMAIVLVDLWSANLAVWGELPADLHFIRPSASGTSGKFTIQNNLSIGGSAVAMVGIGCTFGTVTETEAAIAENFTRTVMDDFVPSTGGSFSGNVVHENANVFVDDGTIVSNTTPSANQYGKTVTFRDSQNNTLGTVNLAAYANGKQAFRFVAQREISGSTIFHTLALTIDGEGNRGVTTDDAAAWRNGIGAAASNHTHSYLPLSGGTLTGRVTETNDGTYAIRNDKFDTDTVPSAAKYLRILESFDTHNYTIGMIEQSQRNSTGDFGLSLSAARRINGSYQYNQIVALIAADGTKTYAISDPANFRSAISAAAASHTHAASDIASGTIPIARGGTGATSASAARTALGIGEQLDDVVIADISLPSANQTTILGTMTVPAGKWLLKGVAYFAANSNGDRKVYLGTGTSYANQRGCAVSAAPGSQVCIIEVMPIMTFTKNTVVNLIPYQNSGGALSTRGMISAVRLA